MSPNILYICRKQDHNNIPEYIDIVFQICYIYCRTINILSLYKYIIVFLISRNSVTKTIINFIDIYLDRIYISAEI